MYSIFQELCLSKGVTPYKVAKETGIATSTLSDWKNGKSTPKQNKLKMIADYFQVSLDYIMGANNNIDKFSDENAKLVAKIRNDENLNSIINTYLKLDENKQKTLFDLIMMIDAN